MSAILAFLTSRTGIAALGVVGVLVVLGLVRHSGAESVRRADQKAIAVRQAYVAATNTATAAIAQKAAADARASQAQIVYRTRTIVEHVHDAIPASIDVRLGPQWVRGYDISLGLLPLDAGPPSGTAGGAGIRSADAFNVVAQNNAACVIEKDRADRLVKLWDAERTLINKR